MSRWQQIIDNCLNEIEAAMEMEPAKDRMSRYGQAVSEAEDSAANRSFPTDLDETPQEQNGDFLKALRAAFQQEQEQNPSRKEDWKEAIAVIDNPTRRFPEDRR